MNCFTTGDYVWRVKRPSKLKTRVSRDLKVTSDLNSQLSHQHPHVLQNRSPGMILSRQKRRKQPKSRGKGRGNLRGSKRRGRKNKNKQRKSKEQGGGRSKDRKGSKRKHAVRPQHKRKYRVFNEIHGNVDAAIQWRHHTYFIIGRDFYSWSRDQPLQLLLGRYWFGPLTCRGNKKGFAVTGEIDL